MTYGNSTDLGLLINSISDSVSTNLKNFALEVADSWVNRQVGVISGTTPDLVEKAATYYAYVMILRNLYDTDVEDSAMVQWYESEAKEFLEAYMAQNETSDYLSPYSARNTPSKRYTKRNLRTDYDYNDYDDVDRSEWDSD